MSSSDRFELEYLRKSQADWRNCALENMRDRMTFKQKCLDLEVENERLRAAIWTLQKAFDGFKVEVDNAAES